MDKESEYSDLPAMIRAVHDKVDTAGKKLDKKAGDEAGVKIYDGYKEDASRLVFHYCDHFTHLSENPPQRTYLPSGISENEPKPLPIRPSDEDPGEEEKLLTRGLCSYP